MHGLSANQKHRVYRLVAQWTERIENKHDYVEKWYYCTNLNNTMVFKKQYILGTFWLTWMAVQGTKSNASCFLFYVTTKLGTWKFYTKSRNIAEAIVILQCSLHLCQQSSSAFEQKRVFLTSKSCCNFFAATGASCYSASSSTWCSFHRLPFRGPDR